MAEPLKPGQKYPTPTKGFGDRVFYETLLRQNPQSEMAQEYCLNYGILDEEEAAKLYKAYCKRKGKPMTTTSKTSSAKKVKKEKKIIKEEVDDVGMSVGGSEGMGEVTM